jgi:hypothetical protein
MAGRVTNGYRARPSARQGERTGTQLFLPLRDDHHTGGPSCGH